MKMVICALLVLLLPQLAFSSSDYDLEKRRLEQSRQQGIKRCEEVSGSRECRERVHQTYLKKISSLEKDPELYFYNREVSQGEKSERKIKRDAAYQERKRIENRY